MYLTSSFMGVVKLPPMSCYVGHSYNNIAGHDCDNTLYVIFHYHIQWPLALFFLGCFLPYIEEYVWWDYFSLYVLISVRHIYTYTVYIVHISVCFYFSYKMLSHLRVKHPATPVDDILLPSNNHPPDDLFRLGITYTCRHF